MVSKVLILSLLFAAEAFGAQLYYSPVTVDHTKVPSDQSNFAVLISKTDARFKVTGSGGHVNNTNGYDIRPYSDSGLTNALTYELERYSPSTGEVIMWVKESTLSSTVDTVIYLGYGDTSLTTNGSSNATWDSNYKGVWHLPDGTLINLADSTSNANTLTNTGSVGAGTGQIDGGTAAFNGTSQALNTPSIDLTATQALTLTFWVNPTSFGNTDALLAEFSTNFNSNNGTFLINPNSSTSTAFDVVLHGSGAYNGGHFTRPTASTGYHYYVFVFDLTLTAGGALGVKAYIDNVAKTITQDNSDVMNADFFGNFALYFNSRAASSLFYTPQLDEIRLSNVARSTDWMTTQYNTQSSPSTFATLGTEVNVGGPTGAQGNFFLFFGTILCDTPSFPFLH